MPPATVPLVHSILHPPIPLPKFTFLLGAPGSGQTELATAIAARDDSLGVYDFEEPLRRATHELFFGGFDVDRDLTDPTQRDQLVLPPGAKTVDDWLKEFHYELKCRFGPSVLARIALADYLRNEASIHVFERILFRDATYRDEVGVFVDHFGGQNILCIHLGQLGEASGIGKSVYHVWLPEPSIESRMAALARELSTPR